MHKASCAAVRHKVLYKNTVFFGFQAVSGSIFSIKIR